MSALDDLSGVKEIYYKVDGGNWTIHYGDIITFILDNDCFINGTIEFYAVDNAGNQEETKAYCCINIDQEPPIVEIDLKLTKVIFFLKITGYDVAIVTNFWDECSGIGGLLLVEFYFNNVLQDTVEGPGPDYVWTFRYWPIPNAKIKVVVCCDLAGNPGYAEIDINDYISISRNNVIYRYSNIIWLLRFFYRFPFVNILL